MTAALRLDPGFDVDFDVDVEEADVAERDWTGDD